MIKETRIIRPIFTDTFRGKVMGEFDRGQTWQLKELSKHMNIRPGDLVGCLAALTDQGMLVKLKGARWRRPMSG